MVNDCAYIYEETGRRCRRIPRRGESLCLAHTSLRPQPGDEDAAFNRLMSAWAERLHNIPLDHLLEALQTSLEGIHEIIQSKSSRRHRMAFGRAVIAVGIANERLVDALAAPRAGAENSSGQS